MDLTEGYAKTQRPPAYAHLLVSSTDRYRNFADRLISPRTSANWALSKQYNVLNGYFTRLVITQLQFQWNIPTIFPGYNDAFSIVLEDGGPPVTADITIPFGFYSISEIAAAIVTAVTAPGVVGTAFTNAGFAVDVIDNSLEFSVTAPNTIWISEPDPTFTTEPSYYKCYYTLGINANIIGFGNTASSLRGSPAPMLATRWLDICSSLMTKFQKVKDTTTLPQDKTSDVISRVYAMAPNVASYGATAPTGTLAGAVTTYAINQPFAGPWIMTIDYNNPKYIKWSSEEPLGNFDIQVRDEYGDQMPWSVEYPTEYQFTILASES